MEQMTVERAIERLKTILSMNTEKMGTFDECRENGLAYELAISALEKQVGKSFSIRDGLARCPVCDNAVSMYPGYCHWCGQAISIYPKGDD